MSGISLSPHPDLTGSVQQGRNISFFNCRLLPEVDRYKPRIGFNEHKSQFVRSCAAEQNDEI
jgi:hypothetical protein